MSWLTLQQESWKYKQTTDASLYTIRSEKSKAVEEHDSLTANHQVMNEKYQAYGHEAAFAVENFATGNQVSLNDFYKAKDDFKEPIGK